MRLNNSFSLANPPKNCYTITKPKFQQKGTIMMYYTPQNPNHALLPRAKKKHPILQILRIAGIVVLSLLLVLSMTLTLAVAVVRSQITPEYVYTYANGVEYQEFPLPVDGEFASVSVIMQESFGEVGFPLTEKDVDVLFDQFSIPAVLAGFAQDVTAWLLFDDARPVLDAKEIASVALSGVSPSILQILEILGDPVELVKGMLVRPLSTLETEGLFDALEPVRLLVSQDVFAMVVSVCLMLAVLVFCLCRCSAGKFCLPLGISLLGTGAVLTVGQVLFPRFILGLTAVYAPYLNAFFTPVLRCCGNCALGCFIAGVVFVLLWLLRFWILKNCAAVPENAGRAPGTVQKETENGNLYTEE